MLIQITDNETDIELECERNSGVSRSVEIRVEVGNSDLGYMGRVENEVDPIIWGLFVSNLEKLDKDRRGEASLESQDLRLTFLPLNRVGLVGIEGYVSVGTLTLQFQPVSLALHNLSELVNKFRAV